MQIKSSFRRVGVIEYQLVLILAIINIWWIGCKTYKNPAISFRTVIKLLSRINQLIAIKKLVRAYKINGKYVWDMFHPSWPSAGFNRFYKSHLLELHPVSGNEQTIRRLIIAITKRCPLQCEHCSEAATLYNKDVLSFEDFIVRIEPFVQNGAGQLIYSGGEPLSRFDDLIKFLTHFKDRCNQWIYTSGFGLTLEKALLLKKAGLDGAAISLDHHLEKEHNTFRGNKNSYYWVIEGIKNLHAAGVLVSINVCPTKAYIDSGQFAELINLAKSLKVPILNILEPRAVGNYQNKDVELHQSHKDYLQSLSTRYNFNRQYFSFPTILFPAGTRKNIPCGGGRFYALLDYDGTLYPCPFCKVKLPQADPAKESVCLVN
jgi:MoaA/NifB/PqqE/SkfB family radical SAM enzyme